MILYCRLGMYVDPIMLLPLAREKICILVSGDVFNIPLFGPYLRAASHGSVVRGRCRALAAALTGNPDTPDPERTFIDGG
ncbi:MAG: hypothetical protein JXA42_18795 [Anaerolineales bacterium]|nr:hypothetical protein [Anaerolineales bacterium]